MGGRNKMSIVSIVVIKLFTLAGGNLLARKAVSEALSVVKYLVITILKRTKILHTYRHV
jgi:hypothetical protein